MNLRPLGYEQYDGRLCRLVPSPVEALTSANAWRWFTAALDVSPVSTCPAGPGHQLERSSCWLLLLLSAGSGSLPCGLGRKQSVLTAPVIAARQHEAAAVSGA